MAARTRTLQDGRTGRTDGLSGVVIPLRGNTGNPPSRPDSGKATVQARLAWPPTYPGLETPSFLLNVACDFPPVEPDDADDLRGFAPLPGEIE